MSNLPCPWYPGYVTNFWGVLEGVCNLVLCPTNFLFWIPHSFSASITMYSTRFWRGSRLWYCIGQILLFNDPYHFSINISYVRGLVRGPVINSFFIGIMDFGQYSFTGLIIFTILPIWWSRRGPTH